MTPPVDVGEGLVVEREAAEENLGALIITNVLVISTIVKRRITFSLKLGDECRGGALDAYGEGFGFNLLAWAIQLKMLIGTQTSISNATVAKQVSNILAQLLEITGLLIIPPTIEGLYQELIKCIHTFAGSILKTGGSNNCLQLFEHRFKAISDLTLKPRLSLHLLLNPIHQLTKPLRHLACAHALPKGANDFQNFNMTRSFSLTKPLEEADDKVQHGVADLVLRDVRGKNAAAGNFGRGRQGRMTDDLRVA
ncbi:uncharacterized protein BcabD6B2_42930 [Babesia caballi]|uniref:Uncharacterized protein n=1 Tax=Babesia caballi TaxID=5871 RepID=A0AAV4LXF2_BABCB|nr:hypothetical protein BcabD6B2_42930 [Babesia caballi]